MRLHKAAVSALTVALLAAVAACGVPTSASGGSSVAASSAGASDSAAASSSAAPPTTLGPQIPAETAVAAPVARDLMPTVSGSFGSKPTITVPSTPAPDTLQRVVLSPGSGTPSKAGDWLQVNYLGQVWGGSVFDNSYDKGSVFTLQVGAPQPMVVAGWDIGLQGVTQGSRVLLSFPPEDGYGPEGSPPTIPANATLIFVVDVIKIVPATSGGQADAVPQSVPEGLPTVEGKLGDEPTVTVPTGMAEPTESKVVLLAKGSGPAAQDGDVVVQYVATTWDGTEQEKSWPDPAGKDPSAGVGPVSLPLQQGSPFIGLLGIPMGSRVLVVMPADENSGSPALAWVMDLLFQQDVAPATTESGTAPGTNEPPTAAPTN